MNESAKVIIIFGKKMFFEIFQINLFKSSLGVQTSIVEFLKSATFLVTIISIKFIFGVQY